MGVYLSLREVYIANNSYVDVDDIGVDENALLCHTIKSDCCGRPNRAGEWYFPNGITVGTRGGSQDEFYRDRGTQVVRLNRRQGTFTDRGLFRCEVPDSWNTMQTIYVNVGTKTIILSVHVLIVLMYQFSGCGTSDHLSFWSYY